MRLIDFSDAAKIISAPEPVVAHWLTTGFRNAPRVYDFDGQLRIDADEFRTWAKQFSFYPREGTNDS
jgi:hypothetical protein